MENKKNTIGIVTLHSPHNYGSFLQTYALVTTLKKIGLDVKVINFQHEITKSLYEHMVWSKYKSIRLNIEDFILQYIFRHGIRREQAFKKLIAIKLPITKEYNNRFEIQEHFNYLVCGSDQIWNPVASGNNDPIYYLDFGDKSSKRFAYAASSGSKEFGKGNESTIKSYLTRMCGIGVRENFMKTYIENVFHLKATVTPDPTLLLETHEWDNLIERPTQKVPDKYILIYSLMSIKEVIKLASEIAHKMKLPLLHINVNRRLGYWKQKGIDFNMNEATPGEFLWLYKHATFIITNTFHGNMFAVIFRKDFVHINLVKDDNRITTLHQNIKFNNDRIISNIDDFNKISPHINYEQYEQHIAQFRQKGLDFINHCINS